MATSDTGGTVCDLCGAELGGYSVLFGLVTSELVGGDVVQRIFCDLGGCRSLILAPLHPDNPDD